LFIARRALHQARRQRVNHHQGGVLVDLFLRFPGVRDLRQCEHPGQLGRHGFERVKQDIVTTDEISDTIVKLRPADAAMTIRCS
jgi:hypothetical protein